MTWEEDRKLAIGASESPAVLGVSPWSSPLAVWARKVGLAVDVNNGNEERMRWGHLLEPVILAEYRERTGIPVFRHDQDFSVRHRHWPSVPMSCTPDAFAEDGRIVQVKTTSAHQAQEWREGVPLHVQVQVQHEMDVMERDGAVVVVLIGGQQLVWHEVERNDEFIANLETKLTGWWNRYVVERVEPPSSPTEACVRMLERLHPADNGTTVELPADFLDVDNRLVAVKVDLKKLEAERKELEEKLKSAIGAATFGELTDGTRWSWKTQDRAEHFVSATSYRVLRRHGRKS